MSKKFFISLFTFLVFVFSGISYAEENPFMGLTQDQVVQKYFEGKQLDTIEGVWLDEDAHPTIIIKSSLIDLGKKYGNYDYLVVGYSSKSNVGIYGLYKTENSSCFRFGPRKFLLRFISQNALYYSYPGVNYIPAGSIYTRIYPNEIK
ncbi:hypothetical protein [Pelosinus baikalensis]|uniref:Uncharacterized protein n=1 Tax=Pelosinus baikalensis TaxID=2892015 RepID=A0ABS8HZE1_9FIRM|nr:hypothetical protein [Pelosinus baikalensis]MCC5468516.1 hypothetical protein [Pelosinus baikalensis]